MNSGRHTESRIMRFFFRRASALLVMVLAMAPAAMAVSLSFSASGPGMVLTQIHKADSITEGHGRKILNIFVDPNCPYCHKLFMDLQPRIARANLTVRWIVVGILRASSAGKAVAILRSKKPLQALIMNEDHFSRAMGGGAIQPVPVAGRAGQALRINDHLFNATGANGVPTLLFEDVHHHVIMLQGLPPNSAALQQVIAGVEVAARR